MPSRKPTAEQIITKRNMVVWKKAVFVANKNDCTRTRCLVKLRILKGTRMNLCTGSNVERRKCRAKAAEVLGFYTLKGKKFHPYSVHSSYNYRFKYELGQKIKIKDYLLVSTLQCAQGIHFFVERKDAKRYKI